MKRLLTEEDFKILRAPLESGRQSPASLGGTLFLTVFMQALMYYLIYYVAAANSIYPNINEIKSTHFWLTLVLSVLAILYSIPYIYYKSQKIQYLLTILAGLNIGGASMYLGAIFIMGENDHATQQSLIQFTYTTLSIALLLFVVTFIRFYMLLKNGKYREGSMRGILRGSLETKSYIPLAIVGSTGLGMILQYLFRNGYFNSLETFTLIILPILIFYTMIFVLPEQLVILYCKYRFKSFNFNERGYLYSSEEEKGESAEARMS
ncbi:ABC transporter ATPase [Bacillus weihaiensis]|uniref:ABC transporter ATPase n=1 Tax=Bacillus weihaiensis TaxID=1547283 RepID=UPI002357195F|nr:ABC transporter ATPase [Bacillus weihaiensis]